MSNQILRLGLGPAIEDPCRGQVCGGYLLPSSAPCPIIPVSQQPGASLSEATGPGYPPSLQCPQILTTALFSPLLNLGVLTTPHFHEPKEWH